jgi:hypothetical protein
MRTQTKSAALPVVLNRRRIAVVASILIHAIAFWALLQNQPTAPLFEDRATEVFLIPSREPTAQPEITPYRAPLPRVRTPRTSAPSPRRLELPPDARAVGKPSLPAAPPEAAPPQQGLNPGIARSLRRRMGCQQADFMGLTQAEREACLDALAAGSKTAPLYPVVSQKDKDTFDGVHTCRKDDDWCLYRSGKGPYPGLVGLARAFRSK